MRRCLPRRSVALAALAAAFFACLFFFAAPARAHDVGLSRGDYALEGSAVTARLIFARRELLDFVPGLDADLDGDLSEAELARGRESLARVILQGVRVRGDGEACAGTFEEARLEAEDGVLLRLRWRCAPPPKQATVTVDLLQELPLGHRHLAHSSSGGVSSDALLSLKSRTITLAAPDAPAPSAASEPPRRGPSSFFPMGVEHILEGWDHLVFLLGLVLVGGSLRALLLTVTAFTAAHSITLALAVLGVWSPSPRLVEPAIALSIAYVGVENFFVADARKRWRITFPFGLIHGFGFAGALQEVAMPRVDVPAALVAFNLGVEAGQLLALAPVLPLIYFARKRGWLDRNGVRGISAIIVVAGLSWFVARVI
jgi:hydrogenase/urease accessory protein HupE